MIPQKLQIESKFFNRNFTQAEIIFKISEQEFLKLFKRDSPNFLVATFKICIGETISPGECVDFFQSICRIISS